MTGSHKCVPVQRMGNIMTVQTESRLWCLYFFFVYILIFFKELWCGTWLRCFNGIWRAQQYASGLDKREENCF